MSLLHVVKVTWLFGELVQGGLLSCLDIQDMIGELCQDWVG